MSDAVNIILNRFREFKNSYVQIFAGDDLKKQKPYNNSFELSKVNNEKIISEADLYNVGSYGVFLNINYLKSSERKKINIGKILNIFIDLDDGATEDHNNLILTNLKKWGITYYYNAKSGHGYHILIPVELETDKEKNIKAFLTYLKENICDKVDIATYTNERLMRFPNSTHNKDKTGKTLKTLLIKKPTREEIKNNSELIFKYQIENKKGVQDLEYIKNIKKKDIFFNSIITDTANWINDYKILNNSKMRNDNFIKNLAFFCLDNKEHINNVELFLKNWEPARIDALKGWMKKGKEQNMTINYFELLNWANENKINSWVKLLKKQLQPVFLDEYEIYYLEEERKDNSYLLYYPLKNYAVQKSLQEILETIYYDCKEKGIDLIKEFGLNIIDEWEDFSFKKQYGIILNTIHKKLDSENRIKLVYNLSYEPNNTKFIYYKYKKYFNSYNPSELIQYFKKENSYNFPHIKELILNLCGNEEESYNYFIKWLGWIIQNPTEKLPTAIIFQGEQGTGKGVFKTHILDNIFANNCCEINQTHLESAFNSYLMGKQIIVANEVMHNENRQTLPNILKNLVTDPEITINRKFQKELVCKNFTHWIFCTNSDNPLKIEIGDRRYSVFYSHKLKGGGKNAVKFVKSLQENLEFELKEFISFLKSLTISYYEVHEPINTEAKEDIVELNKDSVERFMVFLKSFPNYKTAFLDVFNSDRDLGVFIGGDGLEYIKTENFYLFYTGWANKYNEKGILNKQNCGKKLVNKGLKNIIKREDGSVKRVYLIDNLKKVLEVSE